MKTLQVTSSFENLPVEIFWYPVSGVSKRTILLLKGIYGFHNPESVDSWDTELISALGDTHEFICINTARKVLEGDDPKSKEAFIGKTFVQECEDISRAYAHLIEQQIISPQTPLAIVGNSFGGTVLLGLPDLLHRASSVVMIGSGCGKSPTTAKPLLATLPDESTLLSSLDSYEGVFVFVRGTEDDVVPKDSQNKIINRARVAKVSIVYDVKGAGHNLLPTDAQNPIGRNELLSSVVRHVDDLDN